MSSAVGLKVEHYIIVKQKGDGYTNLDNSKGTILCVLSDVCLLRWRGLQKSGIFKGTVC